MIPSLIEVDRGPGRGMAPEKRELTLSHQVLPFSGVADDVAHVDAFLASPGARFVTGHAMVVDGGLSIHLPAYAELERLPDRCGCVHGSSRGVPGRSS